MIAPESPNDEFYMRRAAELAQRALGNTTPNPIVGAVIVRDGEILGEGWHTKAGCPHAEIEAIRSADGKDLKNATIYVTLEPCSSWGRTPPCTDALIRAGFSRVVIGCTDPNPKHAGKAVGLLREHGMEVVCAVEEKLCRRLNEAFFKWIATGKPFVLLKLAMTLDGKIATATGNSRWITGPEARSRVQKLRQWADAVMVGGGTFRTDSPKLTVRDEDGTVRKSPCRIVLSDSQEELPAGWERVALHTPEEWEEYLKELGKRPFVALLLEGGGELAASALNAGAVDRIEFHYAPKILGGRGSRSGVGGPDPLEVSEAFAVEEMELVRLGPDFAVTGRVRKPQERRS